MEYNFAEIGERIRTMRKDNRWGQDKFIDMLNKAELRISRNTISSIENGDRSKFTLEFLLACCTIFDCDMGYLLGEYNQCKKLDDQYIHETTGLSEYAIGQLKRFHSGASQNGESKLKLLNWLMEDSRFTFGLIEKIAKFCIQCLEFEKGQKAYQNDQIRFSEMTNGDFENELQLLMSKTFHSTITRQDLSKLRDLKDIAHFQAQRSLDDVLDCVAFHYCKKNGYDFSGIN